MEKIYRPHKVLAGIFLLICVSFLAWEKVLSFWFFKGFEAGWLMGVPHTFSGLFRAHAYLYYLDYLLFRWNPTGWYATGIITHTLAAILVFVYVFLISDTLIIALPAGLFFVASIAYHDVVTWGSFNSYYGLLVIFLTGSLIAFHLFLVTKNRRYYFFSLVFAFFTFFIRESGLALLAIIPLHALLLTGNRKRSARSIIFVTIPYISIAGIYFLVRGNLGDVVGDYADDSVQMRIRLLKDHEYIVLLWRAALAFGRHFASLWLPYIWLNTFRNWLMGHLPGMSIMRPYVFSFIGFIVLPTVTVITILLRKTSVARYLWFSLVWSVFWVGVIAIAIPSSDTVLLQDYFWNTRRYNYYAYVGVSFFWSGILFGFFSRAVKRIKKKKVAVYFVYGMIIVTAVLTQVIWLRNIQRELLTSIHKESRAFYEDFKKFFPLLSTDYAIYQYPHTDGLNDYLYEWSFTRESLYPSIADAPFRTENQLAKVLEKIAGGEYKLNSTIFLDYDSKTGLRDRTTDARAVIASQKAIETTGTYVIDVPSPGIPVELPYELELSLTAQSGAFGYLQPYTVDRYDYLSHVQATVSATMSQRQGEPFLHLLPEHLVDGNFGRRSGWIADSIPAIVTLDLGKEKSIGAVWWSSEEGPRVPSSYSIDASRDGIVWEKVIEVKLNSSLSRIDYLKEAKSARYIRMTIPTTTTGAFVYLDEIEVIGSDVVPNISEYADPGKLVLDSMKTSGGRVGWVRLSWDTTKTYKETVPQEWYIPMVIDRITRTYKIRIPEMEMFSRKGELFTKFITHISIEPFGPFNLRVGRVILSPIYEINHTK